MAKKALSKTVAFNLRVSLEAAVDDAGSANYYHAGWDIVLAGNDLNAVIEKLQALGVDDGYVKTATKAMSAAAKAHGR